MTVTVTGRLLWLYLRSRRIDAAVGVIATVAALVGCASRLGSVGALPVQLVILGPMIPAIVIGVVAGSPFGSVERASDDRLPLLRGLSLGGLLLWSGMLLAVVVRRESVADDAPLLLRNLAGYTGLTLLGSRGIGAETGWLPAASYGMLVSLAQFNGADVSSGWQLPAHDGDSRIAFTIAVASLVTGLTSICVAGARETTEPATG